jgi:D-glycero-D-manno-heptose 1,7-bisphosphate phosphatase
MTLRPAVFLDRDGTLNAPVVRHNKPYPPSTLEEFILLEGVVEGCAKLKAAGFVLVVATNQPDVGRGTQALAVVEAMHSKLRTLTDVDQIEVCYATGGEDPRSPFRKPLPGMVLKAARELNLDLKQSWMIGDRWRDIDCGHNAGLRTILIDWNYNEQLRAIPDFTVSTFPAAVETVLGHL